MRHVHVLPTSYNVPAIEMKCHTLYHAMYVCVIVCLSAYLSVSNTIYVISGAFYYGDKATQRHVSQSAMSKTSSGPIEI